MLLAGLTSREEAADLLQETFLRVYKARPSNFRGSLSPNYLFRAAETTATDYIRERYAMRAATAEYLELLKSHNTGQSRPSAEKRVLLREIEDAAQLLSQADQDLLRNYAESSSIASEAERIGIPSSTLASRYYAALKRLRNQIMR